jgi:nucleoporin GLE1
MGGQAKEAYGTQWVKLLALLYEGVTKGMDPGGGRLVGGDAPEGKSARVRVQLEIERIMSAP